MNTTPLWVPLVVAALGFIGTVVGTISGVLITQRRADKREDLTWERGQQREHDRWSREDALRTFDQRRIAYVEFADTVRRLVRLAENAELPLLFPLDQDEGVELSDDWYLQISEPWQRMRLWCSSSEVASWTDKVADDVMAWGDRIRHLQTKSDQDFDALVQIGAVTRDAESKLLAAMRKDLGVPEGNWDGLKASDREWWGAGRVSHPGRLKARKG